MHSNLDTLPPYARAVRFASPDAACAAYQAIQDLIRDDEKLDLSVYNLLVSQVPHVVVIGEEPGAGRNDTLSELFDAGEPTHLPPGLIQQLAARRSDQDEGFSHHHHDLPDAPRF